MAAGSPAGGRPRIVAIVNQKGGVGKTTTAINLATALAQDGRPTLVVDLDPQGNASTGLGVLPDQRKIGTYEVISGDRGLHEAIQPTEVENLALAPGTRDLSGADIEMVDDPARAERLAKAISDPRGQSAIDEFEYILIDCPPSLSLLTVNAMGAAHSVLVPLQCEFFALEGLSQLLGTIKHVQQRLNRSLSIEGIVLTMYDRRNNLSFQVEQDVRATLGAHVLDTVIPRNVRLSEAPSHAMPALIYDPNCAGSRAYRALAGELVRRAAARLAA